jgi:hypothetical protein
MSDILIFNAPIMGWNGAMIMSHPACANFDRYGLSKSESFPLYNFIVAHDVL